MEEKPATGRVKEITSLANPIIKDLRALALKKNREREGLFIAEGLKLVLEGLALGWKPHYLVYAEQEGGNILAEKAAMQAYASGALLIKANSKIMEAVTHRANAQNIIGVFAQKYYDLAAMLEGKTARPQARQKLPIFAPETGDEKKQRKQEIEAADKAAAEKTAPQPRLLLALDRVRDPGNLGTIIRTADAAGADGLILIGDTTSPYNLEAVRATMGSVFAVPLARASEAEFLAETAKFDGLIVGTHLKGAADYRTIPYFKNGKDIILLMGNEQSGLTDNLARHCRALARIPQAGRADSLNLAVSTGIMLYEICRGRLHL